MRGSVRRRYIWLAAAPHIRSAPETRGDMSLPWTNGGTQQLMIEDGAHNGGYATPLNQPTFHALPNAPGSWRSERPTPAQNDTVRETLDFPNPVNLADTFDAAQNIYSTPPQFALGSAHTWSPPHPEHPILHPHHPTHLTFANHTQLGLLPGGAYDSPPPHPWHTVPWAPYHFPHWSYYHNGNSSTCRKL